MASPTREIAVVAMSLLLNVGATPLVLAQDQSQTTTTTSTTTSTVPEATGTTTKTSPPATDQSVPDFMKDYAPSTTAVGPVTPVVPPTTVKPVARPTASEAIKQAPKAPPAAAPQKPIVLKGRLEEVSGNGAQLPIGVLLGLKAQKGRMDPSAQPKPKADPLKGLVASFPQDWTGYWGGTLNIWWTQIDPVFWQWDKEQATATAEILKRGAAGTTTFVFQQQGPNIYVEPAKVNFPPRTTTEAVPMSGEMQQMQQMLGSAGAQMMRMLTTKYPAMVLGTYQGMGVEGSTLNNLTVKNDIKLLKPNVYEQNIVTRESERKPSGEVKQSISETVIRFTKINPNQLYVQAASLKYRNDGHFLDKVIFYGTVNRGVTMPDPTNPMMGMPAMPGMGAFPGMPTSPSGSNGGGMPGLDGLTDVIRQLQKGLGQ